MAVGARIEAEKADAAAAAGRQMPARGVERGALAQEVARDGIEAPRQRPVERKPFGAAEQQLAYPPIAGFRLYWFNDTPGRVERAKQAGYEHVQDERGPVARNVGRGEGGGGQRAYLMKIPQQWYWEDMAAAEDLHSAKMQDIRNGRHNLQPGSNQYIPAQGIKIEQGNRR